MDLFRSIMLMLLGVFYVSYFIKVLLMKRHGVTANLLGKGDKPNAARKVEFALRIVTLMGAIVQIGSVAFDGIEWSFPANMPIRMVGIVLAALGNLFFIAAMLTMRNNWRAGFARRQNTNLVTNGIYSISRNPAFVGFDFIYIGCALTCPNIFNIVVTMAAVALFHIQILGEEKFCTEAFGEKYKNYKNRTMRYIGKK